MNDPCGNGGTCSGTVLKYNCTCTEFYDGTHCESNINQSGKSLELDIISCDLHEILTFKFRYKYERQLSYHVFQYDECAFVLFFLHS